SLYIALGLIFSIYRSVYSQTQETNFRLIGVRSPFDETFHDTASYKERTKDRSSTSRSKRELERDRGRLSRESSKKTSRKAQKAKAKPAKKKAPKRNAPAPAPKRQHSETYLKRHRDE
ncbi:MAG: hypothetical protein IJ230_06895, partial [Clostridia bacterium]|nr:hypothetical protein [Clostridia bacterium]